MDGDNNVSTSDMTKSLRRVVSIDCNVHYVFSKHSLRDISKPTNHIVARMVSDDRQSCVLYVLFFGR